MRKKRQTLRRVVCGAGGMAGRKIVRDGLRASAHNGSGWIAQSKNH